MSPNYLLGALAIAFFCATSQPAKSGSIEAWCNSANNKKGTFNVLNYAFKCPGQIVVADEDEIKKLPTHNPSNAFFKGALISVSPRGESKVTYFVAVENWQDRLRCRVLVGPMNSGGVWRTVGPGDRAGNWSEVVQYVVTALANSWADSNEYSKCKRVSASVANSEEIRTGAGLCLDAFVHEKHSNGDRVRVWVCNGSDQQRWTYDPAAKSLRVAGGLCLDVTAGIYQNGNQVQIWRCNGQPQQQWQLRWNDTLSSPGGVFCLDVHAPEQSTNGGRVQIWRCNTSQQQRFTSKGF